MMEEPLLMACQQGALNQDTFAQNEFLKLKAKFGLTTAIETGTCLGYTADFLAEHYEEVRTVEVIEKYQEIAKTNRLNKHAHVHHWLGSSLDKLPEMLDGLSDRTFIFLDAHWGQHCPLKQELVLIAQSGIKPVIAIHDFVVPNHPELGYDSINDQPFTYEWLKPEIDAVYGGEDKYEYYYNSEAVGAKRGIIYIHPKI
jgi:predicted O-methyltransferase YrrM